MTQTYATIILRRERRTIIQENAKVMCYSSDGGRRLIDLPFLLTAGIVIGQDAMSITSSVT